MKILDVKSLDFPDIKVIRYQRFGDHRGYFTEVYRKKDVEAHPDLGFLKDIEFTQMNESFSKKGTIKGMHFQWNPYMAKLVRPISGKMIDLFVDIRKNSPTYGKGAAYELNSSAENNWNEWIWIPVGFAHGLYFEEDTTLEYFVTGHWAPDTEWSISPLAPDIDWNLMEPSLKKRFDAVIAAGPLITDKDKNGSTMKEWSDLEHSNQFIYQTTS